METRGQSEQEHAQRTVGEAARQTGERIKNSVGEMVEAGRETAHRLGGVWESTKNNIQEKAVNSAKATDRVIRDHPYQTIGIAFGIGVLLGVLINRK